MASVEACFFNKGKRWAGPPLGECRSAFLQQGETGQRPAQPVREAVGVFQDEPSLRAMVDELLISGFDRSDIGVVAGHCPVERKFGAMFMFTMLYTPGRILWTACRMHEFHE